MSSGPATKLHLEKIGLVGDLVTLLCCLGFGPALAFFSAIGAGFLIRDDVLAPVLVVFLLVGLAGLWLSRRHHGGGLPIALHVASGAAVFVFTFVAYQQALIWVGAAGLMGASIWDVRLRRRYASRPPSACPAPWGERT